MRPALPALLLGAALIALSPIFVRLSEAGPTATAFWRVALAVPALWLLVFCFRTNASKALSGQAILFFAAGIAFAGDLAFWHASIVHTSVANATLLANLAAPFVTLAVWIFFRQKPRPLFLGALALTLIGVGLLVHTSLQFSRGALLGDAFGVVTAIFYAWYILAVKGLRDRGAATLRVMAVTSTLTALVLLPLALASGETMLPASAHGWWILVGLALVSHAAVFCSSS